MIAFALVCDGDLCRIDVDGENLLYSEPNEDMNTLLRDAMSRHMWHQGNMGDGVIKHYCPQCWEHLMSRGTVL